MEDNKLCYACIMQIFAFDNLDSSQEKAKALIADNKARPFIVIAQTQNQGKGTKGRSWFSPEGGLYMSLVFDLDFNILKSDIEDFAQKICLKSVEVLKTSLIEYLRLTELQELSVKPINDLYYKDAKLAGILLESINKEANSTLILGLGLNVKQLPESYQENLAISLENILSEQQFQGFRKEDFAVFYAEKLINAAF